MTIDGACRGYQGGGDETTPTYDQKAATLERSGMIVRTNKPTSLDNAVVAGRIPAEAFYARGSPRFFRGSSLEELLTSSEKGAQQKLNCFRMKNLMAQVYTTSVFETTLTFRRFWVKNARHSETNKRKCATSIVESVGGSPSGIFKPTYANGRNLKILYHRYHTDTTVQ